MEKKGAKAECESKHPPVILPFGMDPFPADPFGSYTGVPEDILEKPVQDVDDL